MRPAASVACATGNVPCTASNAMDTCPCSEKLSTYVLKHWYAYDPELRAYAELVASQRNLQAQGLWLSTVRESIWDENTSEWVHTIVRQADSIPEEILTVRSDFYILISGLLTRQKLPKFPAWSTLAAMSSTWLSGATNVPVPLRKTQIFQISKTIVRDFSVRERLVCRLFHSLRSGPKSST